MSDPIAAARQSPIVCAHYLRALEILRKLRAHSSRVNADGDHYAAFNHRYLDEIDALLAESEKMP